MRGDERVWWAGCAFFGAAYLALSFSPWLSDTLLPQLGTSQLLGRIHGWMHPSIVQMEGDLVYLQAARERCKAEWLGLQCSDGANHPATLRTKQELMDYDQKIADIKNVPTQEQFQRIGHSLITFLAAFLGGTVAVWFRGRRERAVPTGEGEARIV